MNVWKLDRWKSLDDSVLSHPGLFLHFDKEVDTDLKRSCIRFCRWLRRRFVFPIRVDIYFKSTVYVTTKSGKKMYCTCWLPDYKDYHPYIRIATGDFHVRVLEWGRDNAIAAILKDIGRMLTHYYQWINDLEQTEQQEKRQVARCACLILDQYAADRDHP